MNIRTALAYAQAELADSPTPAVDARLLLCHVLEVPHSTLIAHDDRELSDGAERRFYALVAEAHQGAPIPYVIGEAPFFGRSFHVNPAVLIPRPETELLVSRVVARAAAFSPARIVDVGTGSGCIAVTLACELPAGTLIAATDISPTALVVATNNARRHQVADRIAFLEGHLLRPVPWNPTLVVANLPYVTDAEWTGLSDGVKWYEPAIALKGGVDGLDLVRQLLAQARSRLSPDGALFLEIGWKQGPLALQIARDTFPAARVTVEKDLAGHDRFVVVDLAIARS